MFEWSGLTLCFDGCVYCYILIFCTGDIKQNSFIFRYFLLYIVSGFNVLIKFKNKMNFGEVQESNSNLMYNNTDTSITKRKDPKTMSLSELDEYINKNRSRMMTETNNENENKQNQFASNLNETSKQREYVKELEAKVENLYNENEELKNNFQKLSQILEKERIEFNNRLQEILRSQEMKFMEDNKSLLKQIDDLKLENSISKTNLTILNSEKERHIEQNAIDKEYYEGQIKNLIKENEELKQEMKVKVSNFSSVIKEQEKSLENEYKIQLKSYKEIINRNEKEKKDLIKKYETKLHELQVKINRLEREDAKSKSRSKGKYNISTMSKSTRSKSRSKSKGKLKKSDSFTLNNNVLFTLKPSDSLNSSMMNLSFSNYQSLPAINDQIFILERNIGDLNYNYKQLMDKLKLNVSQDEIKNINRNLLTIKNNIDEQNAQLSQLKKKQQEYLKNSFINEIKI